MLRAVGRLSHVTLLTLIFEAFPGDAVSQPAKGDLEIGAEIGPFLFLSLGGREDFGGFGLFAEPHLSYSPTDDLNVGATVFFYQSLGSGVPPAFGAAYAHLHYYLGTGDVSSYIGLRIGVLRASEESSVFGIGPLFGLRFFFSRSFAMNFQLTVLAHPASDGALYLSALGLGFSFYVK